MAMAEGALTGASILGELGELLIGACAGRQTRDGVTLFKSLRIAIEDLASAHFLFERALATGAGQRVELGGTRVADGSSDVESAA